MLACRAIERQREFDFRHAIRQQIRHPMEQLLQAFPGADGNKDSIREVKPQGVQSRLVFHQVDLVQNGNHPLRVGAVSRVQLARIDNEGGRWTLEQLNSAAPELFTETGLGAASTYMLDLTIAASLLIGPAPDLLRTGGRPA